MNQLEENLNYSNNDEFIDSLTYIFEGGKYE